MNLRQELFIKKGERIVNFGPCPQLSFVRKNIHSKGLK